MEYLFPHSQWDIAASEPRYSAKVQKAINHGFGVLRTDDSEQRYANACRKLDSVGAREMSDRQWMDVLYLLGRRRYEQSEHQAGLRLLNDSLALAQRLRDDVTTALFAFRIGVLHRAINQFRETVDYLEYARRVLRTIGIPLNPNIISLEVQVCAQLGFAELNRGNLIRARGWLHEARGVAPLDALDLLDRALIYWGWALIYRWESQPALALRYADMTCQTYIAAGKLDMLARIQPVAADSALDVAATMALGSTARDQLITAAHRYLPETAKIAMRSHDYAAAGLATITGARMFRAIGDEASNIRMLLGIERQAKEDHDVALLAQTYTGIGDEWLAHGEFAAARNFFVKSLDVLRGQNMDGLMYWPGRGLDQVDRMLRGRF